jgi:ATP-binding cassette subfamily C (CFTR/MRP) protein 1
VAAVLTYLCSYVIAITVAPIIQSLVENQMQFQLNIIGLKMRNGLMAAIYRKCLRLSNAALQSESTGRVVTLMSNDAQKVGGIWHMLWGTQSWSLSCHCCVVVLDAVAGSRCPMQ